jgi:cytochrome c553
MARSVTSRCVLAAIATTALASASLALAADKVSFAREIKPLLARRCLSCHGLEMSEGGLRLDSREGAVVELDSGAHAVVPGDVDASELLARVSAADESLRMPPEGKPLAAEEIAALASWIAAGAEWEKHWAFVPPKQQALPEVKRTDWIANPIDAFILAPLEALQLAPAPRADRRTLALRAYYNLTGLPPTESQLGEFLADQSPDAWPRLIDRLLASPHYGEQWARHWLDVVRFAETNSFERDGAKPAAWRYRDYVIRSFNDDKPYDQFVREQLAGDELDELTPEGIIATGYYRLGIWDDEPADPVQSRADEMDDLISTTSQAFLGLTVGCARCHDHKIDPIPQTDYYGLAAFFADVTPYADIHERDPKRYSLWDMSSPDQRRQRSKLQEKLDLVRKALTAIEEVGVGRMAGADQEIARTADRTRLLAAKLEQYLNISEWQLYQERVEQVRAAQAELDRLPQYDAALALAMCEPRPPATHVAQRGNPHVPGEVVEPHFPAMFAQPAPVIPAAAEGARSAGRRRVLAEWIASSENMLTARVIVNRVWQHHFGRGIVRSANNFGELGDAPTHPELLDWLALWLVEHDWQLKPLNRLIMTSSAYQMASTISSATSASAERALAIDPTNDLFWRFDMRRLSGEEIRDSMLAASGQLNRAQYGPSVYPAMPAEVLSTQSRPGDGWGSSTPDQQCRRSVYIFVKRSLLHPLMTAFDFPDVDSSCEARFVTTQPAQALALLNSELANEQAAKFAERVAADVPGDARKQIARAIELALLRPATEAEIEEGLVLFEKLTQEHGLEPPHALRYWCLAVLNLNELIYLD